MTWELPYIIRYILRLGGQYCVVRDVKDIIIDIDANTLYVRINKRLNIAHRLCAKDLSGKIDARLYVCAPWQTDELKRIIICENKQQSGLTDRRQ